MKKSLLILLLLSGCRTETDAIKGIKFYKHERTQLCFASGWMSGGDGYVALFTWVPCDKIPDELIISTGR